MIFDLLFCFDGGIPFSDKSDMRNDVGLMPYLKAKAKLNVPRALMYCLWGPTET